MTTSECLTIPILSVLKLQLKRTEFLTKMWLEETHADDPENHGWRKVDGSYEIQIQDQEDKYYKAPRDLFIGCSCKGNCKRCACVKKKLGCSAVTCHKCKCIKRKKDSPEEDLTLSNQYQELMDQLSSDESSDDGRREEDSPGENLLLSSLFQEFMDQISSDESSDDEEYEYNFENNHLSLGDDIDQIFE